MNPAQTELLYRTAIRYAHLTGKEEVLDAYCGTGTIGIIASDQAGHVTGVELNSEAVKDAISNARAEKLKNVDFICADAGEYLNQLTKAAEAEETEGGFNGRRQSAGRTPVSGSRMSSSWIRPGRAVRRSLSGRRHSPALNASCIFPVDQRVLRETWNSSRAWLCCRRGTAGGSFPVHAACGDGSIDVKKIKSSARKQRISGLFRRFGLVARLLKKLGFLMWKHIYCKMCVRL